MSVLDIGARCATCNLVDFLPFTCQACHQVLCQSHVHSHFCPANDEALTLPNANQAGPSRRKTTCDVTNCDKPRIEAIGGLNEDDSQEEGVKIAKEVRCTGCGGAYCVTHRAQAAHSCTAPLDHNVRHDAFLVRRDKARALIAEKFPQHATRVTAIPKPPPQKDVIKERLKSPERLPPSLLHATEPKAGSISNASASSSNEEKKVKTKAEKLHELHVRKLRSLAKPLDESLKSRGEVDRRFFEWTDDESGRKVKEWVGTGKWGGKLERVWVPSDMPIGKLLDRLIIQSKLPRGKDPSDPKQTLSLICLASPPDSSRQVVPLNVSDPAVSILDGSMVVLVRGWTDR